MNVQVLKNAGIQLSHCANAMVSELPYTQDVLYALRLTEHDRHFEFSLGNHVPYIANVMIVAAAVASEIHEAHACDQKEHERIIASAIVALCPEDARCLFNPAFFEARQIVMGDEIKRYERQQLLLLCGCRSCRLVMAHENRSMACED